MFELLQKSKYPTEMLYFLVEHTFMVQGKDGHSGVMLVRRNGNDYRLCCTWAFIIMP